MKAKVGLFQQQRQGHTYKKWIWVLKKQEDHWKLR